ncbi:hypothetical protein M8J75_014971 [Diaphorina citri]|nr:hypothetical protein M8J75_008099 [Diaphorina citri]KAI5695977.1 hypothetical protein M8J75_006334 [Diaphorina citri]KAI5705430.1 hypothetical protein M8J75_014971 [Diaphorina citri]
MCLLLSFFSLNLAQILQVLEEFEHAEETERQQVDAIYITPPEADVLSDEDSGDEDDAGLIDNLSSRQLAAPAEVVFTNDERLGGELNEDQELGELNQDQELGDSGEDPVQDVEEEEVVHLLQGLRTWNKRRLENHVPLNTFPESDFSRYRDFSAVELFQLFFDDTLYDHIVVEIRKYAAYKNKPDPNITRNELKCFIGILIISGYSTTPSYRYYWDSGSDMRNEMIHSAMRRNRVKQIISFLHFEDMENFTASDKMWKLKPLLNRLNDNFMEHFIPMQHLNYDESMIAYFGRHGCKQFIRGKPIRFGFKAWCLNTFNGYLINFDIYQGRKDSAVSKYEKHFGKCAAPMVKMLDKMPREKKLQYCLYFDNLFTGMNLLHHLKEIGILGTGTIRENRLPKECKIISSKEIKKKPRGFIDSSRSSDNIIVARWQDNACVTVASTAHAIQPLSVVKRYSHVEKKSIQIKIPNMIHEYNKYMGGTDLMDENINRHRIAIRSKKWWWAIFSWTVDASIQNAWILHNLSDRVNKQSQLQFRREIATTYLLSYGTPPSTGGRKALRRTSTPSFDNLRYDGLDHLIVQNVNNKRRRCAGRLCTSVVRTACRKCDVGLCVPCFASYHSK